MDGHYSPASRAVGAFYHQPGSPSSATPRSMMWQPELGRAAGQWSGRFATPSATQSSFMTTTTPRIRTATPRMEGYAGHRPTPLRHDHLSNAGNHWCHSPPRKPARPASARGPATPHTERSNKFQRDAPGVKVLPQQRGLLVM